MLAALNLISLLFQRIQKRSKIFGLVVQQNVVDHCTELVAVALFGWVEDALLPLPVRLFLDNRKLMLQTNQVT